MPPVKPVIVGDGLVSFWQNEVLEYLKDASSSGFTVNLNLILAPKQVPIFGVTVTSELISDPPIVVPWARNVLISPVPLAAKPMVGNVLIHP